MMSSLPPGAILMLGAPLLLLLRSKAAYGALLLTILSFLHLLSLPGDLSVERTFFDIALNPVRVDRLSLMFGYVFHLAAFLSTLFALHVREPDGPLPEHFAPGDPYQGERHATLQHIAGPFYAGAAIAAAFAGDFITLFLYWELTAISSVFLIWARRTPQALSAAQRYLVIQIGSGVTLLAGMILLYVDTGSLAFREVGFLRFDSLDELSLPAGLILVAFGIKAAFPFLHNWLQDAYPNGTATGTVFLSAFTTKLAIYALARAFAGSDALIYIGCVMTAFPIFFAVIENDLRRVLAYSLNNQLGFMVVGIGVADFVTSPEIAQLALNGAVAHAFAHIVYKGLLFMAMGAVMLRVGSTRATDLGGLYKSMPYTAVFCIIGAMSISAFPLFSGFTTKGLTLAAVGHAHLAGATLMLLFASAGVMEHSGIKIPFFAFFAHDSGLRVKEAPWNMLAAMGIAAVVCIGLGVYPAALYAILPFEMVHTAEGWVVGGAAELAYNNYTPTHVITQLQLLMFAVLAFGVLVRQGIYPSERRSINLDFDWIYRRLIPRMIARIRSLGGDVAALVVPDVQRGAAEGRGRALGWCAGPGRLFGRTRGTGTSALGAALLLCLFLVLYYL